MIRIRILFQNKVEKKYKIISLPSWRPEQNIYTNKMSVCLRNRQPLKDNCVFLLGCDISPTLDLFLAWTAACDFAVSSNFCLHKKHLYERTPNCFLSGGNSSLMQADPSRSVAERSSSVAHLQICPDVKEKRCLHTETQER